MLKQALWRAVLSMLAISIYSFSLSTIAQDTSQKKLDDIKQRRIQELKLEFEQSFAQLSKAPTVKRGNVEVINSRPSVLVARKSSDGQLETACIDDALAAAKFIAGETPTVNLSTLRAKE